MATWKWSQERPAEGPSRWPTAECSGATRCAPVGDTLPSPRWMAVGLHRREKSGGLPMENGEEGCAPQPPMLQTLRSLLAGKTTCLRSLTQWTRSRSFAQRSTTGRSSCCRPRISRTRRRARRPRAAACSLTAADTWRVVIQAGSGDGDGGDLICWMCTPWDGSGTDGN